MPSTRPHRVTLLVNKHQFLEIGIKWHVLTDHLEVPHQWGCPSTLNFWSVPAGKSRSSWIGYHHLRDPHEILQTPGDSRIFLDNIAGKISHHYVGILVSKVDRLTKFWFLKPFIPPLFSISNFNNWDTYRPLRIWGTRHFCLVSSRSSFQIFRKGNGLVFCLGWLGRIMPYSQGREENTCMYVRLVKYSISENKPNRDTVFDSKLCRPWYFEWWMLATS